MTCRYYLNAGGYDTAAPWTRVQTGLTGTAHITVADLNWDGFPDLVYGGSDTFLYTAINNRNQSLPVFRSSGLAAAGYQVGCDSRTGDFNNDGHVDILSSHHSTAGSPSSTDLWLAGATAGAWSMSSGYSYPGGNWGVGFNVGTPADFDSDGALDAVIEYMCQHVLDHCLSEKVTSDCGRRSNCRNIHYYSSDIPGH